MILSMIPRWWRGRLPGARWTGVLVFAAAAVLVTGGLAWMTDAALRQERAGLQAAADAEVAGRLRVALWRLDSLLFPYLARETARPYHHYAAVFAPSSALRNDGNAWAAGAVLQPSPLLSAELPDWMLLHFQTDMGRVWTSPQVLSDTLNKRLSGAKRPDLFANSTPTRRALLTELCRPESAVALSQQLRMQCEPVSPLSPDGPGGGANNPVQTIQNDRNDGPGRQVEDPAVSQQVALNISPNDGYQRGGGGNESQQTGGRGTGNPANPGGQDRTDFQGRNRIYQNVSRGQSVQSAYDTRDALDNFVLNGEAWFRDGVPGKGGDDPVPVQVGPMAPMWAVTTAQAGPDGTPANTARTTAGTMPGNSATGAAPAADPTRPGAGADAEGRRLLLARQVLVGTKTIAQGVLLDWPRLQAALGNEVRDILPVAVFRPVQDPADANPERRMTALPIEVDPGPIPAPADPGWTPMRIGLGLAWGGAAIALAALGMGGWSLIALSERRIRFVSAVTHELRTPLTTLRVYLDLLAGGLVKDEGKRAEYLATLHGETERLNRLVANVLDFARLENRRPQLQITELPAAGLVSEVAADWTPRAAQAGKTVVVEDLSAKAVLNTDAGLLRQVLGNLVENAVKHSRGADDPRVVIRCEPAGTGRLRISVSDHGPGIPASERRSIFRPFRRGREADATAGGVGLGLALAAEWVGLLGGRLRLCTFAPTGACFAFELPLKA